MAGNDENAMAKAKTLLMEFGWNMNNIIDIVDITAARAMESYLILMVRLSVALKIPIHNIKVIK